MLLFVKVNIHDGLLFRQLLFYAPLIWAQLQERIFLRSLCSIDSLN